MALQSADDRLSFVSSRVNPKLSVRQSKHYATSKTYDPALIKGHRNLEMVLQHFLPPLQLQGGPVNKFKPRLKPGLCFPGPSGRRCAPNAFSRLGSFLWPLLKLVG
jgi:hypothetical protein